MKTSKRLPSALVKCLAMLVLATAFSACSSSGTPVGQNEDGQVGPMSFSGEVRNLSGLYTGTCKMTYPDGSQKPCTARIRLRQDENWLKVRSQFFPKPSRRNNSNALVNIDNYEPFHLNGNALSNEKNEGGSIGTNGFGLRRSGQDYTFSNVSPARYEFTGGFMDDSNRLVLVTGKVQRGVN